jgi:hypothetical protein
MSLLEANKVKQVIGNTQFVLTAPANRSYRIRDIHIAGSAAEYAQFTVDKTTVAYFRVGGGTLGNHLPFQIADEENVTLYRWMLEYLGFTPIPVASGQSFAIVGVHDADSVVCVEYDEYNAGDVSASEPNGSQANRFQFINYGRYTGTLADGENRYSVQQTIRQYPAFPFGEVVSAKTNVKILGIVASDISKDVSGTDDQKTTFLKLVRGRKVLFDDDLDGLINLGQATFATGIVNVGTGQSLVGNYDDVDRRKPFILPVPLEFKEGESLDVFMTTSSVTGADCIAAKDAEIGMIMDVTLL